MMACIALSMAEFYSNLNRKCQNKNSNYYTPYIHINKALDSFSD